MLSGIRSSVNSGYSRIVFLRYIEERSKNPRIPIANVTIEMIIIS
jgi:hypothetical protein